MSLGTRIARYSVMTVAFAVAIVGAPAPAAAVPEFEAEVGADDFCVPRPSGGIACGEHAEAGVFTYLGGGGIILAFGCTVAVGDPDVLATIITGCWAQPDSETGFRIYGLRNGMSGPATATIGGAVTTGPNLNDWKICQEGEALFIDGSMNFGPFCTTLSIPPIP